MIYQRFKALKSIPHGCFFRVFFEKLPPFFSSCGRRFRSRIMEPKGNRMPEGLLFFFLIEGTTLCYNKVKNSLGDNNGAKYVILANSEGEPVPR